MDIQNLLDLLNNHFNGTIVKHFAYDEGQTEDSNSIAYESPALFFKLLQAKEEGLYWFVRFELKLDIKNLTNNGSTITTVQSVYSLIENFIGTNASMIKINEVKFDHKKGNSPTHIFVCSTYQR